MPRPDLPAGFTARFRIRPGTAVALADRSADDASAFAGEKEDAKALAERLNRELETLQETLWARRRERLLVVLQGMDASGKDGVIRQVFDGVNPIGVKVASFKAPTAEELARDFLWRVHRQVPAAGEITIFNRSHYEDVLVARVMSLVPEPVWRRRYDQIRDFERLLVETGTTVLKFFLHISRDEQRRRFAERLEDPAKHWKFDPRDLDARARWDAYEAAFEEALARTSTDAAPWYVVPADRKWFRDLVVASVLVETLRGLRLTPPAATFDPDAIDLR